MSNPRPRSWSPSSALKRSHPRRARATSASSAVAQRLAGSNASGLYVLARPSCAKDESTIGEGSVQLELACSLREGWEQWTARGEAILATRAWGRAAASAAAARRELAEREPTEEERIIGSGWLSYELPNYPTLHTWGRLPTSEDDGPGSRPEDDECGPWTWGRQPTPENDDPSTWPYAVAELAVWRDEFIDYCEVVRACPSRRASLGLAAVSCSSFSPCVLCRYHPGANLPCRSYWRSISLSEIDALIAERETERSLRDDTIRRVLSQRERDTIQDWHWNRRTTSRSRSPSVREGMISVLGRSSSGTTSLADPVSDAH